jgi:rubrerythrin
MKLTKDEVVKAAAQLERDGYDFYLDAAKQAGNDLARQMFESLADDEIDHLRWIERAEPGVNTAEQANRALYARLRPIYAGVSEQKLKELALADSDIAVIEAAIEIERKAAAAYAEWAEACEDPEVAALCKTLVGVETFHQQVLSNTREYFEKTADWFMQEEQWNFEGA